MIMSLVKPAGDGIVLLDPFDCLILITGYHWKTNLIPKFINDIIEVLSLGRFFKRSSGCHWFRKATSIRLVANDTIFRIASTTLNLVPKSWCSLVVVIWEISHRFLGERYLVLLPNVELCTQRRILPMVLISGTSSCSGVKVGYRQTEDRLFCLIASLVRGQFEDISWGDDHHYQWFWVRRHFGSTFPVKMSFNQTDIVASHFLIIIGRTRIPPACTTPSTKPLLADSSWCHLIWLKFFRSYCNWFRKWFSLF